MSLIIEEYINDTSNEYDKASRLNILRNYISVYGKTPTELEYRHYKQLWYNGSKATVKCNVCGSLVTNGWISKHYNTKKCKT